MSPHGAPGGAELGDLHFSSLGLSASSELMVEFIHGRINQFWVLFLGIHFKKVK